MVFYSERRETGNMWINIPLRRILRLLLAVVVVAGHGFSVFFPLKDHSLVIAVASLMLLMSFVSYCIGSY